MQPIRWIRLTCLLSSIFWFHSTIQAADLNDQLAVMLQLDNMLEKCPGGVFGKRGEDVDRQFELLEEAGVRWCRSGVSWEMIEPRQGQWNWAAADHVVHSAKKHHVNLLWIVGNTAPWDSSNNEWNGVPKDLSNPEGHFVNFVRKLVDRYKKDVHFWEIRNEPNLDYMWAGASSQKYASYLHQASRAIKETDSESHVVFGGLGGNVGQQIKWFHEVMQELRKRNGALPFEIANFHVYPGEADNFGFTGKDALVRYMTSSQKKIEKALKEDAVSDMPLWITEFDFPANTKDLPDPDFSGPAGQAKVIREIFPMMMKDHPERKIFWASLLDDYNDEGFHFMGLLVSNKHHDIGTPRPAYHALKKMLTN